MSNTVSLHPKVEVEAEFPLGAPIKGKVYAFDHNYKVAEQDKQVRIVVMSNESWAEFGTNMMAARNMLKKQDDKLKTLIAEGQARERVNADLMGRLDALRAVRRAEKRIDIEAEIANTPQGND